MTESHTPGPWTVEPRFRYGIGFAGAGCLPIVGGNAVICAIGPHDPYMPQEANARLISAAPDMLAALRDLIAVCEDFNMDGEPEDARVTAARAVIAKATA